MALRFSRRIAVIAALIATAVSCFTLGVLHNHRADAFDRTTYDRRLDALREEFQSALTRDGSLMAGTSGTVGGADAVGSKATDAARAQRASLVAAIKEELRTEMGLLPVRLIRERRSSFVELYTYDNLGQKNYGTAGYLGDGYFITVKHAVAALGDKETHGERKVTAVKIVYQGKEIAAKVIDMGDAVMEVDPGDWAIIRTRNLDLPRLNVDTSFAYEFATPIFRLGNDYSKGVVVSTGYIGQRTPAGLVTSLTDGHPGVSGGGVLDQRGVLVGVPIGRMQGDYRFSFILPVRAEMLRHVPVVATLDEVSE
jgi:trypsin-like peptidase